MYIPNISFIFGSTYITISFENWGLDQVFNCLFYTFTVLILKMF